VHLDGYTEQEKVAIARDHLLPRQQERAALSTDEVTVTEEALALVAGEYTHEAGVRQLERALARVLRKATTRLAADPSLAPLSVGVEQLRDYLGRPRFTPESAERTAVPGVATGLAVTGAGCDVLFVEASVSDGDAGLRLTGQLGDVMKESAQAALSFLRSRSKELRLSDDFFNKHDVHIHVPAGAVPKDGPSAGVAIATSLVSALTGRKVESGIAMTGEITLTGQVLPVGGIKEKVLGARRAGIKRVVLPTRNEPDMLEDVPAEVRKTMKAVYVDELSQALKEALGTPMIAPVVTTNGRRNGRELPAAAQ